MEYLSSMKEMVTPLFIYKLGTIQLYIHQSGIDIDETIFFHVDEG